ncbi:hypothetical protein [Streptomyces albidoflavus]|uniref:hypothetical protein n=1 Tax=Streptomyces albidoflavus TaxID=1886 RepID=UPI0033D95E46
MAYENLLPPNFDTGWVYLLDGRPQWMPGPYPNIVCVASNQDGRRCSARLPTFNPWRNRQLALRTDTGLLWISAVEVPETHIPQYAAQHCTRHHRAPTPPSDALPAQWEDFDPETHPGAHALDLPPGEWTIVPSSSTD